MIWKKGNKIEIERKLERAIKSEMFQNDREIV